VESFSSDSLCQWEVRKGETCGAKAQAEVTLRNRVGGAKVPVCLEHKAEHNRKAAALRADSR
jgi:hypothetical protein